MTAPARDTVILPMAGAGSRLGLPFPKELVPIGPGRVALDATVDLLAPHADRLRVVAVVDEHREATVRHLRARCAELALPFVTTFQDPALVESTGAVLSAAAWFGPATLVLLPDQIPARPEPETIRELLDLIHAGAGAVFLAARETDPARLAVDGALRLCEDTDGHPAVADFADKPGLDRAHEFDAVWFGYGFAAHTATTVLAAMHGHAVRTPQPPHGGDVLIGATVVEMGPFTDLGTWPRLTAHWRRTRS
ncbi:hypothetical protein ACFZBU_39250 [Embleya sp. NPDC008237]|uniref:hypothetical protein n=1 Tax=Embleya sp. NPDC008237 TaxID=3363978 RepID=UPI0036F13914